MLRFCCFLVSIPLYAHAILVEANPAPQGSVSGPDVPVAVRFNSRVDVQRSRLMLVLPDGSSQGLQLDKDSGPAALLSRASGLRPGRYTIRWQVLAADGHITRGEFHFSVK
jgi:methionine-rich copper-binding protein CopC